MKPTLHLITRDMSAEDIQDVAALQVAGWQSGFKGIVSDDFLSKMSVEVLEKGWRQGFEARKDDPRYNVLVATTAEKALSGFLSYGPARDQNSAVATEIYAIYVTPSTWGAGIGRALFNAAAQRFRSVSINEVYLWVLQDNRRAIAAYERWGGTLPHEMKKDVDIGGKRYKSQGVVFTL